MNYKRALEENERLKNGESSLKYENNTSIWLTI
jgi:hypothetical protein